MSKVAVVTRNSEAPQSDLPVLSARRRDAYHHSACYCSVGECRVYSTEAELLLLGQRLRSGARWSVATISACAPDEAVAKAPEPPDTLLVRPGPVPLAAKAHAAVVAGYAYAVYLRMAAATQGVGISCPPSLLAMEHLKFLIRSCTHAKSLRVVF